MLALGEPSQLDLTTTTLIATGVGPLVEIEVLGSTCIGVLLSFNRLVAHHRRFALASSRALSRDATAVKEGTWLRVRVIGPRLGRLPWVRVA